MEIRFISTSAEVDPLAELWAEPVFAAAYAAAENAWAETAVDAVWDDDVVPDSPDAEALYAVMADGQDILDVHSVVRHARAAVVAQDALFHRILVRAGENPDPWVGPDPTLDRLWQPRRQGETVTTVRARRRNLAVRSAAADIAVRVSLTDHQVRNRAHRAAVLSHRCPRVWGLCLSGEVSEQNIRTTVDLAASLPDDDTASWAMFDEAVSTFAATAAPGRFRIRARAVRERAHREPLQERHTRASAGRCVWVDPLLDGMAQLSVIGPAADIAAIDAQVDDLATHLASVDGETRTKAQLRADALFGLFYKNAHAAAKDPKSPSSGIVPTVRVTIPVLTLMGHSDEPATLDGYGPIDLDTAKTLAATADTWIRVLTHPITGTVMDVDRKAYKVPEDLKRLIRIQYPTCAFPGCQRPSDTCDLDHRIRWTDGGATSRDNLTPECPAHHPIKDETLWGLNRDPDTGRLYWTTPTGYRSDVDPPPF
ncbi:DUF222 domain-containing protein [Microbacterium sp.]|uniref:HNH endonuclease signature motif containing protein n=1 Tax=Microbacterium sp. TaxID=51671 RepID=UPI0039E597B8